MYNLVKNVSHLYRIYLKNCWFLIYPRSEQMKRVEFQKFLIVREITLSIKPNPLSYHTHISIIPASLKPAAGIKLFIRALHSPVPIHLYNDISNIIRPFIQQTGVVIVHTKGTKKKEVEILPNTKRLRYRYIFGATIDVGNRVDTWANGSWVRIVSRFQARVIRKPIEKGEKGRGVRAAYLLYILNHFAFALYGVPSSFRMAEKGEFRRRKWKRKV